MDWLPLDTLLHWLSAHPGLAGAAVFAIACLESLAVVGLFMPGAVLMFAVGAIIGAGALPFWPVLAWAVAGAIAGDGVSFWLGRRFHDGLATRWPFRAHPQWLGTAIAFFHNHGGKSVLMGRFVGPIRPVIPAVAGMMDMPAPRFFVINVFSALLWAPAYLLPGVVFGASLGLAAEVATRLVLLVLALTAVVVLAVWAVRAAWRFMQPRTQSLIQNALTFARNHPLAGRVPRALLDPQQHEAGGLLLLAGTLILSTAAFIELLDEVGASRELMVLDDAVFHAFQWLRTPWMDTLMVAVTQLGDWQVLLSVFIVILAWLLVHRRWSAALYWLAAAAFAQALIQVLKLTTAVARPADVYSGASAFAFPSGHATSSTVVYGFLAVLLARELPPARRWLAYAVAAPSIALIAFSRLYLGVHWLSDVLGGLSLGLVWVALLGIAYRRHPAATLSWRRLLLAASATLTLGAALHIPYDFANELQRYRVTPVITALPRAEWWAEGWRSLPTAREDLRGRADHPLNVQYAGSLAQLTGVLGRQGWRSSAPLDVLNWLRWFGGGPLESLPLLPQVHDGRHESLLLVKPMGERLLGLRLWDSGVRLTPGSQPLWLGTASTLVGDRPLPGLVVPRTVGEFVAACEAFAADLSRGPVNLRQADGVLLVNGSGEFAQLDHGAQAFESLDGIVQLQQQLLLRQGNGQQLREARADP